MLSLREKNIAFYLSFMIPIEICMDVVNAMKVCEFEDSRDEHMMDCSYFRTLKNITHSMTIHPSYLSCFITENNYITRLYKHVDADQTTYDIPERIRRLSNGPPVSWIINDNQTDIEFPDSLLNEGNPTLSEKYVSQELLSRVIKDNRYSQIRSVFHNIINDDYNEIIINDYNDLTNNTPIGYGSSYQKEKKDKKKSSRRMKRHNSPVIQKAFINKSFRKKCR